MLAGALALGVAGVPRAGWAQDQPPRPHYQGLFGSPAPASRSLDIRWSLLGVYDDNVTADTASYDPRLQVNGAYGLGEATLTYMQKTKRHQLTANGRSTSRYYPQMTDLSATEGSGDLSVVTQIGRRSHVSLFQGATYQPYYQLNFMGVAAPSEGVTILSGNVAGSPELGGQPLRSLPSYIYDGKFGWGTQIGRRDTLSADYSYRHTIFGNSVRAPFDWQLAAVKFTHPMTRYAALRLGYGYSQGRSGTRVDNHNIDVGVDYSRPLSRTRRTKFNFSSGSSIVEYANQQYFVMNGDAELTHEVGRSGTLSVGYHRGVQFVEGVIGPMMADTVRTGFSGYLGSRVEAIINGGYSSGQIGLGSGDPGYATYTAGAGLRVALNRLFSIDMQYLYDQYDFDQGAPLLVGVPRALDRQSIRVGVTGWVPLLHRSSGRE